MPGYNPNRLKGLEALTALEQGTNLFCYPQDAADVLGKDLKTTYDAIKRGEIPAIKIGQRYSISIAWLRRQVDGIPDPQPARRSGSAA
jgi:excisionase family DNA binding protein